MLRGLHLGLPAGEEQNTRHRGGHDAAETLRDCQAFLANGSLTVGANPAVDFGVVYVHLHRNAALVRDMFQLIQRVGRSSETGRGKLHNPVIHIVIHDASIEQKNAERQAKIAKGQIVAPLPTFEESLSKVRDVVQGRKKGNSSRLRNAPIAPAAAGTFPAAAPRAIELPEWVIRGAAWCDFEAQRRDAMMTEEVEGEGEDGVELSYLGDFWTVDVNVAASTSIYTQLYGEEEQGDTLWADASGRRGCKVLARPDGSLLSFGGFNGEGFSSALEATVLS